MAMSKKDYEAVAAAIKAAPKQDERAQEVAADIAVELGRVFSNGNPRFDLARFLAACGVL